LIPLKDGRSGNDQIFEAPSDPNIITIIAGEDIEAGQIVCLKKNDNADDKGVCLIQSCNGDDLKTLGIALNATETGNTCRIQIGGIFDVNSTIIDFSDESELPDIDDENNDDENIPAVLKQYKVGGMLYCGEDGQLVEYVKLKEIKNYVIVGKMIEPTKLLIQIKEWRMM
jgi:hypothetical protein